jgi:hypothetical protein
MNDLIRHYTTGVWLLLAALTASLWWLGGGSATSGVYATVSLMVIAFFKVRLVGIHFMELRWAPLPLRLAFEAWTLVTCLLVLAVYWAGQT